ncbi:hypothetical protein M406DRAFT_67672 [Cryphonectria parasitica EP155]|uniref:Zn(2)-C6 fungal-type domain-containing protein n=1 Tax=Cryphonectria parasitica (strain ATCC 38755 / EP155) TaxID=660469 RepID=A0A9P5CU63_CRYP1|nr:uncharacterized protein M406DRAFT_67672 [Cryphonectria parasitica EP155]KAF3771364.1 hypothetical protein M406DRAFT_67672 [Cryphonectria parasitica EP155]
MVNTGKPSPGCFACRSRRIKCDTTRPECRKCRKRGWKCPGYRDLNALRIVDETQKQFTRFSVDEASSPVAGPSRTTIVRQSNPPPPPGPPGPPPSRRDTALSSSSTSSSSSSWTSPTGAHAYPSPVSDASSPDSARESNSYQYTYTDEVPRCVGTPVGEQVYTYFVANFVAGSSLRHHGYLDFLFPLLANISHDRHEHNPLPMAFTATAMIAFAARQKVPELLPRAESVYLRALGATFEAIGDAKRARDNSTLACVTLLTTFEQLRPSRPSHQKAEAFGSHLDGAVALLKMRGKDLFQTVVGRKIFQILRSLLASRSLCYGTPLDPELHTLTEEFEQHPDQHRFAVLSLRAADLRVAAERLLGGWSPSHPAGDPPTREKVEALKRDADVLEADYDAHIRSLPLAWKAMTVRYLTATDPTIMGGISYVGRVDAYIDMFICYLLNWSRAARLYIRYASLRCHAWLLGPQLDYRDTPEYAAAAELGVSLVGDIVASVPYVFGAATVDQQASSAASGPYPPPSLAGVFCMWPVFAAATSDFTTESQRVFLKRTLKFISEEMGIGQASILAKYNLRNPSMPIAFTRMKQFESQGKQLQGVASGAAAGSVMTTGITSLLKTTGSIMSSQSKYHPKSVPMHILKREPEEDDEMSTFDFRMR